MQNTLPILLGSVTIFGVVVNNQFVFLLSMIIVILTGITVMISIILNCYNKRAKLDALEKRRVERNATHAIHSGNSRDTNASR